MGLLTIGSFARAARLSPKALRLYDELGLLRPAQVDPNSGYRFYDLDQLEQARLVAWLRRLGMPLAQIRVVCGMPGPDAAHAVALYWSRVEVETAARRDLAAFLIEYLSGKDTAMAGAQKTLGIRYAVRSDIGMHRKQNEDSAYAGARLLAVADGLGGHAGGEVASAAAIDALKPLDTEIPAGDLLNALEHAVHEANDKLQLIAESDPSLRGLGTTLTAMLWSGSQLALVHIGDSRAYLLREGELFQITHDHTLVQTLIDEGRITPDEAASHPQRSLLMQALDGRSPRPDLQLREATEGDRYLLCSDGLYSVVAMDKLREVLSDVPDPEDVVQQLIDLANSGGGPDNITCVVADVIELPGATMDA
jgi:serine/threonine protein phosphatase PrpC